MSGRNRQVHEETCASGAHSPRVDSVLTLVDSNVRLTSDERHEHGGYQS